MVAFLQMQKKAIEVAKAAFEKVQTEKVSMTCFLSFVTLKKKESVCATVFIFVLAVAWQDVACKIKKDFDAAYPETTWHCIVGSHFGTCVTAATGNICFMQLAEQNVLLLYVLLLASGTSNVAFYTYAMLSGSKSLD